MRNRLISCICLATAMAVCGCDSETDNNYGQEQQARVNTTITPYGHDGVTTRTSYNVTESDNKAVTGVKTSFVDGDAIGVFVVTKEGKIVTANDKCSLSNGSWTLSTPISQIVLLGGYRFYAYYPYNSSISSAYDADATVDGETADDFFGTMVSAFSPINDQSSVSNFCASDLMVAKGTAQSFTISFNFSHSMGLVVTKAARYFQKEDGTVYLDDTNTFSGNLPYAVDGWLLYFVKPNTNTQLGKYTYNIDGGEYFQDVINI